MVLYLLLSEEIITIIIYIHIYVCFKNVSPWSAISISWFGIMDFKVIFALRSILY